MSTVTQRRRGTTVQHATYSGMDGEITVDTSKHTLVVQDGTTAGGHPLAREDFSNVTQSTAHSKIGLSTDGTLSSASDSAIPSQKAVKTYADAREAAAKSHADTQVATRVPTSAVSTDGSFSAMSDSLIPSQKAVALYVADHAGSGGSGGLAIYSAAMTAIRSLGITNPPAYLLHGAIDAYNDQTGIGTMANITHDTANKWLTNYGDNLWNYVTALFHFDNNLTNEKGSVTLSGSAPFDTTNKKFGTACLDFDGTKVMNFSGTSLFAFTGDFQVDLWFRPTSSSGLHALIGSAAGTGGSFMLYHNGLDLTFGVNGANLISAINSLTVNLWHRITISRSGSTCRMFVNGTLAGSVTKADAFVPASATMGQTSGTWGLVGQIDDLRVTDGACRNTTSFVVADEAFSNSGTAYTGSAVSAGFTAVSAPKTGLFLLRYQDVNNAGITLNSDLIARISRDGGTTWSVVPLLAGGIWDGVSQIAYGSVSLGAQPNGTSIKYKIETANGKALRFRAAYLGWEI